MMPIKNRIGELARQKGLNVQTLADKTGVAYNTAHGLYTGRSTRIGFDVLEKFCRALESTPGDLFVLVDKDED